MIHVSLSYVRNSSWCLIYVVFTIIMTYIKHCECCFLFVWDSYIVQYIFKMCLFAWVCYCFYGLRKQNSQWICTPMSRSCPWIMIWCNSFPRKTCTCAFVFCILYLALWARQALGPSTYQKRPKSPKDMFFTPEYFYIHDYQVNVLYWRQYVEQ